MRRPWIKIETATADKPEICAIASRLRMDEDMVVGKLVRLWSWVALNRVDGSDLGVTMEFLDKLVGRKGFAAALCHAGWLHERDGKLSMPNFDRHNSDLAKTRALTSQRVARHRVSQKLEPLESNSSVTENAIEEPLSVDDEVDTPSRQPQEPEESQETIPEAMKVSQVEAPSVEVKTDVTIEEESEKEDGLTEDLENVLSINADPTFKPLHTESVLDEPETLEEPKTVEMKEEVVLPQESAPPTPPLKKSRRKADDHEADQAFLF